jgi:hypothetical protein
MSLVKQYYHVILQAGDGTEWKWQVTNNYFKRRMEVIDREIHEAIRQHDKDNQFTLSDPSMKFEVTLVHIDTMATRTWTGHASDRYDAVGQAVLELVMAQVDNLDAWKVLEAVALP